VQHEQPAQHASGYSGRIPEDRFHANFGREHVFVINRPVIVDSSALTTFLHLYIRSPRWF